MGFQKHQTCHDRHKNNKALFLKNLYSREGYEHPYFCYIFVTPFYKNTKLYFKAYFDLDANLTLVDK